MISKVYIVYNPTSTGPGQANAEALRERLKSEAHHIQTLLIATTHAKHAVAIAKQHADGPSTLIVSSSGDGGFHEVINGVLTSPHPDTVVGLLPSGNANDHYHSRHSGDLVERIIDSDIRQSPVLQISWAGHNQYAHSYLGVGLTAQIGRQLNKARLNPWREVVIVARGILKRRGVKLIVDGRKLHYDSLIYAISGQMSKYFQTGADQIDDTQMAAIATPRRSLAWLLAHLVKRAQAPSETLSLETAEFTTLHKIAAQCDGEVFELEANTTVSITVKKILHEII